MGNAAKASAVLAGDGHAADVVVSGLPRMFGRLAQFLLGIPLGLFQLAAVIVFSITDKTIARADWLVAAWGLVMATACALLSLRVYRSARARLTAFAFLGAQALFSVVKLTVYHEPAALVFLVIIALTLTALVVYHRARHE